LRGLRRSGRGQQGQYKYKPFDNAFLSRTAGLLLVAKV
jgi:hypothetical protein